jgi:predicted ATPase/DNA-binding CsgD family transcriptional regulator
MDEPFALERSFVGRHQEITLLCGLFETAAAGRAGVALVTGEPGIGKTRLLEEVATRLERAGAITLWGGASATEGMPPYLPFIEALGRHIQSAPPQQLREQAGLAATSLATILPELAIRMGDLPFSYPLPPEQARLRLFDAVGVFLAAVAASSAFLGQGGALLVLDDLQWADPTSLDLLCHIAGHQRRARLLILGAYRTGEVTTNPALVRMLNELNRLRVLTPLSLAPFGAAEITELAANYLDGPLDEATGKLLCTQSEGNPFFAEELLRGWLEADLLNWNAPAGVSRPRWVLVTPEPDMLPPSIVGAIQQRLARFPTPVVDQLRVAAIIGRVFSSSLLADVTGQDVEEVEELLLEAERACLIQGDGSGAFAFCHDMTRECLYTEVSSARRLRLHGRIGLALEAGTKSPAGRSLDDLAFHFSRSRDRLRGVTYSRQAAEQALHAYAAQEAVAHYQAALDLLEEGDGQRGDLLVGLGEAALLAADEERAAAVFDAALSFFERGDDSVATARAAHGRGLAHWRLDKPLAARMDLERAQSLLDRAKDGGPEAVRVSVDLASLLGVVLGQHDEAIIYGRGALELAQRLGDARLESAASRAVGFLLVQGNDLTAGLPLLERALELAAANDDPAEAAEACAALAQAYVWSVAFERSRQVTLRREEFAQSGGQPHQLGYVYTWFAFLDAAQGDWSAAERHLAQARPAVEHRDSVEPLAFWRQVRGYLAFQRGDYPLAEQECRAAVELFRTHHPGELVLCLGPLGLALLATGNAREARACIDEQQALLSTVSAGRLPLLSATGCLALTAVGLGDADLAEHYYRDLLACQGQHHWFLVDRILGQAALLGGDYPAAAVHLTGAEAAARREGLRPELGRVLLAQADLALAHGGPGSAAHARRLLGEALALFRGLGVAGEARAIRRRLRSLPRQPSAPARPPLPAGLSPREAEVLRLVAAGMTNRQIAQQLSISASTVAKHLTSIFAKTATENRAAAAAFAIRSGLV